MTQELVWLGLDGQRHGPYSRAQVERWIAEQRLGADALGWCRGQAGWQPLRQMFPAAVPTATSEVQGSDGDGFGRLSAAADFPRPPALHWGWLCLIYTLTLGLAGYVWPFLQAGWTRRIDPHNRSSWFFAGAYGCWALGGILGALDRRHHADGVLLSSMVLELAYVALWLYALYAMASSIRSYFQEHGIQLEIGPVTLLVFNTFYLQGQLSRLAKWHDTGVLSPKAPKAIFWWLMGVLPVSILIAARVLLRAKH